MTKIMTIDPGLVNGIAWGNFDDTTGYELDESAAWDFDDLSDTIWNVEHSWGGILLIERFIPQSGADYTLKENDLAAIETIGMLKHGLIHNFNEVYWQLRSQKANVSDKILKDHGLWRAGSDVNWTDGRDVNDAIKHSLEFLRIRNHLPTLRRYFR